MGVEFEPRCSFTYLISRNRLIRNFSRFHDKMSGPDLHQRIVIGVNSTTPCPVTVSVLKIHITCGMQRKTGGLHEMMNRSGGADAGT